MANKIKQKKQNKLDTIPARVPLEDRLWLYFLIFSTVPA